MPLIKQHAYLKAIDHHLANLASARIGHDKWVSICDVLSWLYRVEEAAKKTFGAHAFYAMRSQDERSQTFAALTWFQGLLDHHEAEVKGLMLQPAKMYVKVQGRLVETTRKVEGPKGWVDAPTYVAVAGKWPDRSTLPVSGFPAHDRDQYYERHVAGKGIPDPLTIARAYVSAL
jgi:hypothetical protein